MKTDAILCKIEKEDNLYKITIEQGDKKTTLALKDKESDAKELALDLFNMGKVGAVEFEGGLIFL